MRISFDDAGVRTLAEAISAGIYPQLGDASERVICATCGTPSAIRTQLTGICDEGVRDLGEVIYCVNEDHQ